MNPRTLESMMEILASKERRKMPDIFHSESSDYFFGSAFLFLHFITDNKEYDLNQTLLIVWDRF
jgi:hypothetical protein